MEEPGFVQSLLDLVAEHHTGLGPLVLFLSSLIEYVFPPFPGDLVTLFGAYLVVQGLWSFPFAMTLTVGGSLVGSVIGYGFGRWLAGRVERLPSEASLRRWTPLTREKFMLLTARFERHGAAYIAINRFLPGIRAFFFVAAGAARMKLWKVLFFALLSALAWNGLILGVGYSVGANWERLRSLFASYTTVVWIALGGLLIGACAVWWVRKRRGTTGKKGAQDR
jgi:membrane protein DedA with SNARE-associated domain